LALGDCFYDRRRDPLLIVFGSFSIYRELAHASQNRWDSIVFSPRSGFIDRLALHPAQRSQ
jgi:hypothetical protein